MEAADTEHAAPKVKGIPRLSRLPRAAGTIAPANGAARSSQIPRLTNVQPSGVSSAIGNSTNVNNTTGNKFGWVSQNGRNQQTSINGASEARVSTDIPSLLPTDIALHEYGSNNVQSAGAPTVSDADSTSEVPDAALRRKKPRPSLSERTMETMAQIPPSPSPSRRKSSITSIMTSMPPPVRPASQTGRRSPAGHVLKSPSLRSPGKINTPLPVLRSPHTASTLYSTPSRRTTQGNDRVPSSAGHLSTEVAGRDHSRISTPKTAPIAHRMRSLRDLRTATNKQLPRKASLNFKDIAATNDIDRHADVTVQTSNIAIAPRTLKSNPSSKLKKRPSLLDNNAAHSDAMAKTTASAKSSASLRETIAKAKAEKRQASGAGIEKDGDLLDSSLSNGISSHSLKRRIQNAVTSGTLNVAALGLTEVPKEIMQMYDFNEGSYQNWSEAVDLTKLIIADNELAELPDTVFPDWSNEELQEDEDKSNIFGGLEILDLRGNSLQQLPIGLRRLERLHTLNISNNTLASGALEIICDIPKLRDLYLANNNLTGPLPACVERLTHLHTLDLHDNKLTGVELSLSLLTSLRKLDLSGNMLESLPTNELECLPLTDLDVSRNRISSFKLSKNCTMLSSLQNLNLSSNELRALWEDDVQCHQLQSLIVDNNHLPALPNLVNCSSLITLTASHNRLEDLPDGFVDLQLLRSANFGSNNIRMLDPYISKMDVLSVLNLASNPLRDRKYLTMSTPDLKAELSKRLTAVLIKDESEITTTGDTDSQISGLVNIEKGLLDLSSRNLSAVNIAGINFAGNVSTIDLSKNKLQLAPMELLHHSTVCDSLKTLTLSHNTTLDPISYIASPITLSNLRSLSLASTGIVSIVALTTHMSAPLLAELNLCCNRLQGPLPTLRKFFPALTTLLISDNELTSLTPNSISGLEVVDVRNNDIEFLPPKIGELGNPGDEKKTGRLRTFECTGNKFRVPRLGVLEKGTEAVLRDLRRMIITDELGEEWRE